MEYLNIIELSLLEFIFFVLIILLASFVRGFSGFGFSLQVFHCSLLFYQQKK